jgi:hypothetical protein
MEANMPDGIIGHGEDTEVFTLMADTVIAKWREADLRETLEGPYASMISAMLRPHYTLRLITAESEASVLEEALRLAATSDQWVTYQRELKNRLARAGLPA